MTAAITFDFHNTLVRCDRWFDLEVRTLPAIVNEALSVTNPPADSGALTNAYSGLRKEIIEHGRELDAAEGVSEAFKRVGVTINAASIRPIIDQVMAQVVEEAELMPGVQTALQFLRANNVMLGIVSSAVHHQFLEWSLDRLGIQEHFEVIVTSALAGFYKSRPEIFAHALEILGATPARSVHVGDSYRFDHLAGQRAGLATVWLNQPSGLPAVHAETPDLELTTLEGAGPALLRLLHSRQIRSNAY